MTGSDGSGPLIGTTQGDRISAAQRDGLQLALLKIELAESLIDRLVESPADAASAEENERLSAVKADIAAVAALIREWLG